MAIEVNEKTFLIVGTGAMACLFAARLAAVGADVVV
jgi:ketopantoate reductase